MYWNVRNAQSHPMNENTIHGLPPAPFGLQQYY